MAGANISEYFQVLSGQAKIRHVQKLNLLGLKEARDPYIAYYLDTHTWQIFLLPMWICDHVTSHMHYKDQHVTLKVRHVVLV